ncbi:TPA: transketolase [Candidatus Collierbacteria bacterium]|uniref:Transketolase domain protein n=1 Tax=Candidatus Collierbacteria bacterium GW2011_GWA2_42_17 TaxID=1618378 RepID=A0A0G1C0V3_9BACT|nr:MAG: Transketolase domain protein [Candidatus Collierbacteria bacterium GW2011_GWB2_42_12]KKS43283.1 MAG: Transketolase domain protein [Candidatus Collierbacteria bacterium GW2011_GWA2_42_17]KKS62809.1 MAG: Transketolase domain protein [Candidatus Collierbacteria bacterium GW2011_GWE2_42_48]KKS63184.1 MAG: Transketolase domain protein [Candidatus Collierbacteria bacterium GW2011_GWD2_42_50]KKS65038.1 MAG: Transketolase domain protein [Candidatus Collierbacteria bacterium GW2011_GWF2_42_51]K
MKKEQFKELRRSCRENILKMTSEAGSGHLAGPLGIVDILIYLYHEKMSENDDFILSCAHMVPALYSVLNSKNIISDAELLTLRKFKSRLQGHATKDVSLKIPTTGGSLGQGIGYASGMALSKRIKGNKTHTYCLISDGELNEGSSYEALLFINKFILSNLTVVVDYNNIQQTGFGEDIMPLPNLTRFFSSFNNFSVINCDGNSIESIEEAFLKLDKERPNIIICKTVGGKGLRMLENNQPYHSKVLTKDELNIIIGNEKEWTLN